MIKILLMESQQVVREGIEVLLAQSKGYQLVGSVGTGQEGLKISREKLPDVILLNFKLSDMNGLEVTRKLLRYHRDAKILLITNNKSVTLALQLLEAGIAGYFLTDCSYRELDQAIRALHHGQRYISPEMASLIALHNVQSHQKNVFDNLSPREMEVVLCLANGLMVDAAAEHLHIAKKTVHTYRYRIFEKLNVQNDLELLRLALQAGIAELGETPTRHA